MIHHVQVTCPAGTEDEQRAFYTGVLGWAELPKPPLLAARGGCWFEVPGGGEVHVGVEDDFRPARKAHPAFVVDVEQVARAVEAAGHPSCGPIRPRSPAGSASTRSTRSATASSS